MVTLAIPFPGDARADRLTRFLLASLALHAIVLALAPRSDTAPPTPSSPPLSVRFAPSVAAGFRAEPRNMPFASTVSPAASHRSRVATSETAVGATAGPASQPATAAVVEPARPAIDMDATLAAARALARESNQQRRQLPTIGNAPPLPLTVESAVARAARPNVEVESRGADGEWVVTDGKKRCVTPTQVPHFLEGKTMLTQCELRKG